MPIWGVVAITVVVYTLLIMLGFKLLQKGTNHLLMFNFPVVVMDSDKRRALAAKQLGTSIDDIYEVTKGRYASKEKDTFIVLKPFFGIEAVKPDGTPYVETENVYNALLTIAKIEVEKQETKTVEEIESELETKVEAFTTRVEDLESRVEEFKKEVKSEETEVK